jgi:SAM-dependent methyltransferase
MRNNNLTEYYKQLHSQMKKYGKPAGPERINIIQKNVGSGRRVLDLGCRDGMLTQFFTNGNSVTGTDIDDNALRLCEKNLGINVCCADMNHYLPFKNACFDVAVAAEVIEHLFNAEIVVNEVSRVLKKGGMFIGTVPNAYRMKTRLDFLRGKPLTRDPSHIRFFHYKTLYSLLIKYFGSVTIMPLAGHIIGNNNLGIPITEKTPLWLGRLFSGGFFWKAIRE